MNQDQIVQLLLDAARGVVRARFGASAETLWPSLEPGLRGAAGKLVGDAIEAAKRMAKPTAAILPAPVLPGEADAIEKLDKYRKETMDALDVASEAFSDPVLQRRFRAEVRDYEYLGEREESRIAKEWAQDPSSSRWVNSKRIPLNLNDRERVRAYKRQGAETLKIALRKHDVSMEELKRKRNDLVQAMRIVLKQAEEEKQKGNEFQYFSRASLRYAPSPYAAQKMLTRRIKSVLEAASALEEGRNRRAVQWASSQIGPETAALLGRMKSPSVLFDSVPILRDVLEPSELARTVADWAASESETLGVMASRDSANLREWEVKDKVRDAEQFLRAVEEMRRAGIQIPDTTQYAANAEKLESKGKEVEKKRAQEAEEYRAAREKIEKEEKARMGARPDFAHPYVENFQKAATQAQKKKNEGGYGLQPLRSKVMGVFPTDEQIRSKWTQADEDRIEKRAEKFFVSLDEAKRRHNPALARKTHSDGSYAYVSDGRRAARFVTKKKESIPDAFQSILILLDASSQRNIFEVDGKSLSWLAQIVLAADKDLRQKGSLGIATEIGHKKVFAVDNEERGSVIKQTLPVTYRGTDVGEFGYLTAYVKAEDVKDALVGYDGKAYLSLPSPQEAKKNDLHFLTLYRDDGEAHLLGAKIDVQGGQD